MLKKIIATLLCWGGCWIACAQMSPDKLKEKYEADKRNLQAVKEYAEALKAMKNKQEAEAVVREYMARCPVLQIEDKDTYLLINSYVFSDPYANVFEYGIYAVTKMRWDRVEQPKEDKQVRLMNIFKGMSKGVSGGDEIDKRYEVLMLLSNTLKKEIDKQCQPVFQDNKYIMPEYDTVKQQHLQMLVNKGELLGQDGMRVKLGVCRDRYLGHFAEALRQLCFAADLNITGIRGEYLIGMLYVLADERIGKEEIGKAVELVDRLCREERRLGGTINYYNTLGRLYHLYGDSVQGEKYTRMGNEVEAEKAARFEELMKAFKNK